MNLKKIIPDATEPPTYGKPYAIILLRLFAGVMMFFAGFEKATNQFWNPTGLPWTASGFLTHVAGGGAFHNWFVSLAGPSTIGVVNTLVVVGELSVGLAFILGIFIRFAAVMGGIEVGLFWIAAYREIQNGAPVTGPFNNGWSTGPLEICAATITMFIVSALLGGGLIYGLDAWIHKLEFVKKHPKLKIFLG